MRQAILLLTLATAVACSSSGGFERSTIEGGAGQPITVEIVRASAPLTSSINPSADLPVTIQLEISNNSDRDVTITSITLQQQDTGPLQIASAHVSPNATVLPPKTRSRRSRRPAGKPVNSDPASNLPSVCSSPSKSTARKPTSTASWFR